MLGRRDILGVCITLRRNHIYLFTKSRHSWNIGLSSWRLMQTENTSHARIIISTSTFWVSDIQPLSYSLNIQPALETQMRLIHCGLDNVVSGYLCPGKRLIRPGCPLCRTLPRAGQLCLRRLIRILQILTSTGPGSGESGGCGDTRLMQIMAILSKWMVPVNGQRGNYFPIKHLSLQGLN